MTSERDAWIALASVEGVGDATFERLIARWHGARAALDAVSGLADGDLDRTLAGELGSRRQPGLVAAIRRAAADPHRVQRAMDGLGGWILTPFDPAYPARLAAIGEPPRVIFGCGERGALARTRSVAVVGTRSPTPAARHLAALIAQRLVQTGVTVLSGLAVGIDGAVHRAVLDAHGETVAVIGSGPDVPGPAAHRSLARRIGARGAVIGELAPGVHATRGTFPRRNRIIAALATATIVVEAPARSGALITARHALEQGRQVLVVPGRPFDRRIAGNLALLRETPSLPLVGLDEMIVDLGLDAPPAGSGTDGRHGLSASAALEMLGPQERAVARALGAGPRTVDGLCAATGLAAGSVAAALTILQLRGWARVHGALQVPAGPLLALHGAPGDGHRAARVARREQAATTAPEP